MNRKHQRGPTSLQKQILREVRQNPDKSYLQISRDLDCSISHVSDTVKKYKDILEYEGSIEEFEWRVERATAVSIAMSHETWFRIVTELLDSDDPEVLRASRSIAMEAAEAVKALEETKRDGDETPPEESISLNELHEQLHNQNADDGDAAEEEEDSDAESELTA